MPFLGLHQGKAGLLVHTPRDILNDARTYDKLVALQEPRTMATAWHAHDACRCCGSCLKYGQRSPSCSGVLDPESIVLSLQGLGPAGNIAAFTGDDIICCPEFYGECAHLFKEINGLWVLLETNGYGGSRKTWIICKHPGWMPSGWI